MKKNKADKKFTEAIKAISDAGESPVNYMLSYVRGYMDSENKAEYLHEWDDGCMRIQLTKGEQIH